MDASIGIPALTTAVTVGLGCGVQITEQCMSYLKKGKVSDILPILIGYKATLLLSILDRSRSTVLTF